MDKLLTIQLVGYNSAEDLPTALSSLRKIDPSQVDIIYLDNASRDKSIALVKNSIPWAKIIHFRENLGFSGAHNYGFRCCQTPFVMTLNPDVAIDWPGTQTLLKKFDNKKIAAIQGKLYQPNLSPSAQKTFDSAGIILTWALNGRERGTNEADHGQYDQARPLLAVSGAAGIFRLAALRDIASLHTNTAVFDEDFFAYKEDIDLGWRLNRHGWQIWYYPVLQGTHRRHLKKSGVFNWELAPRPFVQRLRDSRTRYSLRNWVWLVIKNISPEQIIFLPFFMARLFFFIVLTLFYWPLISVWFEVLRQVPAMLRKRYES